MVAMLTLTTLAFEPWSRGVVLSLSGRRSSTRCWAVASDVPRGRGMDGCPPRMDTVACRCAMSNYDNCACAGMLLLPHGTHKHLRRACARLAGARATSGCLCCMQCAGGACEAQRQQ